MAEGSSDRGTSAGTTACQEGVTLAQAAPSAKEMAMITQGVAQPRCAATARTAPRTIMTDCPASSSLRRFYGAGGQPAGGEGARGGHEPRAACSPALEGRAGGSRTRPLLAPAPHPVPGFASTGAERK